MHAPASLALIDWEGLTFAPPEADLFMFKGRSSFAPFMDVYQSRRPGYRPDETAFAFYKSKRKLEDIYEFTEQLCFDEMAETARTEALSYLAAELKSL